MTDFSFVLLYVDHPPESAAFYERLFGKAPLESSPTFAMFDLRPGVMLGLWSRHTVLPAAEPAVGGSEIIFTAPNRDSVSETYREWTKQGLRVAQTPVEMDFGYTFVCLDPDGHRLRVCTRELT